MSESTIRVNRFWELVDGKPLELVRAIVEAETEEHIGEVIERGNIEARSILPDGINMYLPVTWSDVSPVIVGYGFVQVTWIITEPVH